MSRYLTTFSGKGGDILWGLATVKQISQTVNEKVDFCCRPDYRNMIPLIQMQPYIDKAFVDENWLLWHSNHGDQPNVPQDHVELEAPYEKVWHLTYKGHPGINSEKMALIDFVAWQQGMRLTEPVCPWIEVRSWAFPYTNADKAVALDPVLRMDNYVAYAFNTQYDGEKQAFRTILFSKLPDTKFIEVSSLSWPIAAAVIANAACFVGCKSANYVLAHAVAQKNIFVFEPHPGRNPQGHLGEIFGNPHWPERVGPILMPFQVQAEMAASFIRTWKEEKLKEVLSSANA